jgi:hypothetical protein
VSLELSAVQWKVAVHDGFREKPAVHTVSAPQADVRLRAVLELLTQHKQKWSLPSHVRVVVSCEAGQDGFWILRALSSRGIDSYVRCHEHSGPRARSLAAARVNPFDDQMDSAARQRVLLSDQRQQAA